MIIVHHLNFSRSNRIIWMLEEMRLPYRLVKHQRTPGFAAPPSLKNAHTFGKAPFIEDGDLVIAESAVILSYLNDRYAAERYAPSHGSGQRLRHDQWLHWVEGSAAPALMNRLYGTIVGPYPELFEGIVSREAASSLSFVSSKGTFTPYLMGTSFTIADIQLCYVLELAEYLGLLDGYATLVAYLNALRERPAYMKSVQIGGPMAPPRSNKQTIVATATHLTGETA